MRSRAGHAYRPALTWRLMFWLKNWPMDGAPQQALDCVDRHAAIAIVRAVHCHDEGLLRTVVTDALEHRAAADVAAFERGEIDGAVFGGLDRL
jgi:hypothetical protein